MFLGIIITISHQTQRTTGCNCVPNYSLIILIEKTLGNSDSKKPLLAIHLDENDDDFSLPKPCPHPTTLKGGSLAALRRRRHCSHSFQKVQGHPPSCAAHAHATILPEPRHFSRLPRSCRFLRRHARSVPGRGRRRRLRQPLLENCAMLRPKSGGRARHAVSQDGAGDGNFISQALQWDVVGGMWGSHQVEICQGWGFVLFRVVWCCFCARTSCNFSVFVLFLCFLCQSFSCDALLTVFPLLATILEIIRCMQSEHIWTLSPCQWSKMTKKSWRRHCWIQTIQGWVSNQFCLHFYLRMSRYSLRIAVCMKEKSKIFRQGLALVLCSFREIPLPFLVPCLRSIVVWFGHIEIGSSLYSSLAVYLYHGYLQNAIILPCM